MRILGIDPGSENTGYGIIESDGSSHEAVVWGTVRTQPRRPFPTRLLKIYLELSRILDQQKTEVLAIEEVFHAVNVKSALRLGHARGIALLVAAQHEIPVYEYSPLEIKNGIVGYGRAEKAQVQAMVQLLLRLPETPDPDAADALAVAVCHAHQIKRHALLSGAMR